MSKYRTAQGKIVDMAALVAQNETTRAVGNMKVNARGDTIDDTGKIIVPVTQKVGEKYQRTVGNKSAQPVKQSAKVQADKVVKEELSSEEKELEAEFDEDIENQIIKLKEQELKK